MSDTQEPTQGGPCENTDRELYREPDTTGNGSAYSDSIHVTAQGTIGINCGGTVITRSLRDWHRLAASDPQEPENEVQALFGADTGLAPVRIWVWLADNGNIRKWDVKPFAEGTEYRADARSDAPVVKALTAAKDFIALEYADARAEQYGEWLAPEARNVFGLVCEALSALTEAPQPAPSVREEDLPSHEDVRGILSPPSPAHGAIEALRKTLEYIAGYDLIEGHPQQVYDIAKRAKAALAQPAAQEGWRPTHRHKKRGSEYQLLGIGKMQAEHWVARELPVNVSDSGLRPVDMREVAIYVSKDGDYWVRPREEFEDGRFETIPAAPSQGSRS